MTLAGRHGHPRRRVGCTTVTGFGGGGRRVHPGTPPTDRAPSLRPNGGTGAVVSSQLPAPARRRADELGPPSLGVAAAVRVVFGTRVVGVTLVHCPCRVLGPLQARGQGACAGQRPGVHTISPRLPPCTRGSA